MRNDELRRDSYSSGRESSDRRLDWPIIVFPLSGLPRRTYTPWLFSPRHGQSASEPINDDDTLLVYYVSLARYRSPYFRTALSVLSICSAPYIENHVYRHDTKHRWLPVCKYDISIGSDVIPKTYHFRIENSNFQTGCCRMSISFEPEVTYFRYDVTSSQWDFQPGRDIFLPHPNLDTNCCASQRDSRVNFGNASDK